jgi:pyridoxal phosphate enzyme (YggS family)
MAIKDNLVDIENVLVKYNAKLLPVVKNREFKEVKEIYDFGYREFAENRLEDYYRHIREIKDAQFHFIAPLQSRKIKEITSNFKWIHSVSRYKEIEKIKDNFNNNNLFLQINIDNDFNKSGINLDEVYEYFQYLTKYDIPPIGLMCIPNIESDSKKVFSKMENINSNLKKDFKNYRGELSMGMSNDYEIALDYGATIIRIGTKIFI